jgi:hypothetical protein
MNKLAIFRVKEPIKTALIAFIVEIAFKNLRRE